MDFFKKMPNEKNIMQKPFTMDLNDKKAVYSPKMEYMQIFRKNALITASFTYKPEEEDWIYVIDMLQDYEEKTLSIKAEGIQYDSIGYFSYDNVNKNKEKDLAEKLDILNNKLENLKTFIKHRSKKAKTVEEFQKIQAAGEIQYITLREEQRRLKEERKRLRSENVEIQKGFRIHLTGEERKECRVFVQYIVPGIYWNPVCVINGIQKKGKIIMESRAQIHSSIEFKSVRAMLSTGIEGVWRTPILNKYIIKREDAPKVELFKKRTSSTDGILYGASSQFNSGLNFNDEPSMDDTLFEDGLSIDSPNASKGNFNSHDDTIKQTRDYTLNEPLSSQGRGEVQNVVLEAAELDAQIQYLAIPSVSDEAYLSMHSDDIQNQYKRLMGTESLWEDISICLDERLLRTEIAENVFQNSSILFERINGIISERVLLESKKEKSAFGKKMTINESYRIIVKNCLETGVDVIVMDNIPVTTEEEIDIRRIKDSGAELDQKTGYATWKKSLAPRETIRIDVEYIISYPSDMPIGILGNKW